MKRAIFIPIILMGCSTADDPQAEALSVYLKIEAKEMSDVDGYWYFKTLSESDVELITRQMRDRVGVLDFHNQDPQKHLEANCNHVFDECNIKKEMKNLLGTLAFMHKARGDTLGEPRL